MNKSALIDKIKELEGLSNDEKSALLGLLRSHKKYGLVWEDKPEDVEERLKDSLPVLTEVKDRAIISDSPDAPNHILIEGDNLEALTTLSYTHEGKVDVIYIDPPYNTGKKDFIYNDEFEVIFGAKESSIYEYYYKLIDLLEDKSDLLAIIKKYSDKIISRFGKNAQKIYSLYASRRRLISSA